MSLCMPVAGAPAHPEPEAGERLYLQHCAACHGARGEGAANWRVPDENGELPAPPHGPEGHTWRHGDGELLHMICNGWRDPFNETERLTMPAFRGVLTGAEAHSVVAFLKTLWTEEQRRFQARRSARERATGEAC